MARRMSPLARAASSSSMQVRSAAMSASVASAMNSSTRRGSSRRRASNTSSASCGVGWAMDAPRLGVSVTTCSLASRTSTGRTRVRETPKAAASLSSTSLVPGGSRWSRMADTMRSYMSLSLSWPVVSGCTGGSVTAARARRGLGRVVVIRVPFLPRTALAPAAQSPHQRQRDAHHGKRHDRSDRTQRVDGRRGHRAGQALQF